MTSNILAVGSNSQRGTSQSDALTHIRQQTGCGECGNQDVVERPKSGGSEEQWKMCSSMEQRPGPKPHN